MNQPPKTPPEPPDEPPDDSDSESQETVDSDSTSAATPTGPKQVASRLGPGAEFGSYKLIRLLGQGGFGSVWEADDANTGRRVALKLLSEVGRSSPDMTERFRQEARLAASLNHANIVFVFGAEEVQGTLAIAMEIMPAGTLQDHLRDRKRIPVSEAVDYALQLLDGLEVAHRTGIVHRDIKPSNCFIDDTGSAKLGDFGIAKSLVSDSSLTRARSFIGTPGYSSPEQIRGREIDSRADLYSLGATLFTLLNGYPPFEEGNAIEVVARILSENPRPFTTEGGTVPKRLQETILRLLAKDPGKRHQTCQELRASLLPYSSEGIAPAPLGLRTAANVIDHGLVSLVSIAGSLTFLHQMAGESLFSAENMGRMVAMEVGQSLWAFLFFFLPELLWGRSLGKHLFHLRIYAIRSGSNPQRLILMRNLVFHLIFLILQIGPILAGIDARQSHWIALGGTSVLLIVICSTMRRTNMYAGLHEVLSGTRVGLATEPRGVLSVSSSSALGTLGPTDGSYGPYRATNVVWKRGDETLLTGRDDILDRDVWIHVYEDYAKAVPVGDLAGSRTGGIRWLQGSRGTGYAWDAYEAPGGESYVQLVERKGRLTWSEQRKLLASLLEAIAEETDSRGDRLTLHHLWVDSQDRIRLLHFPTISPDTVPVGLRFESPDWLSICRRAVSFGLTGSAEAAAREERPPVPLPEHAGRLVDELYDSQRSDQTKGNLMEGLEAIRGKTDRIRAPRRLGILAIEWTLMIVALSMLLLVGLIFRETSEVDELKKTAELQQCLIDSLATPGGEAKLASFEKVFAYNYVHAKGSFVASNMLADLDPEDIEILDRLAAKYPDLEKTEYLTARDLIKEDLGNTLGDILTQFPQLSIIVTLYAQLVVMALALLFAVLLRGGLLLAMFGLSVQTRSGEKSSRLRCLLRTLVAWSPLIAVWLIVFFITDFSFKGSREAIESLGLIAPILVGIYFAMRIHGLFRPERGIEDRLAGTVLQPR